MPITPRYEWTQEFNSLSIQIHGTGFRPEHLEIAELYLGLSSPPYHLGLDLYQSVESDQCEVRILSSALQIKLPKSHPGLWPELCLQADPEHLCSRRNQTIKTSRQRAEERRLQALQQKSDSRSNAQKRIWNDEDQHRSLIQQLKQKEENEAKADLVHWAESSENHGPHPGAETNTTIFNELDEQAETAVTPTVEVVQESDNELFEISEESKGKRPGQGRRIPAVRSNPAVLVRFTAIDQRAGPVARDPNEDDEFAVCPALSNTTDDVTDGHAQLLYEKGLKFQRSHDYLSATSAFTSVLQISPTDASALLNRADCYLQLASFRGAAIIKKFERIRKCIADCNLALARSHPPQLRSDLFRTRAQANLLLGNFPTAISDLEDAINLSTTEHDQKLILKLDQAITLMNRRQDEEKVDDMNHIQELSQIEDLLRMHPHDITYLIRRAQICSEHGQNLEAIDNLTECLAVIDDPVLGRQIQDDILDTTTARIYQLRGTAHLSLDHFWQAGDDFSAAIRHGLQPDLVQHHFSTIKSQLAKHRSDPAEPDPEACQGKDPLHSLLVSAAAAFQQQDASSAKRLYSEALRLNPPAEVQAQIMSNRAATELYLHEYDACIRDSTSSMEFGNHNPVHHAATLSRRAAAYSAMGSLESAQDDLKAALSLLDPGTPIAQQCFDDLRRLSEAVDEH